MRIWPLFILVISSLHLLAQADSIRPPSVVRRPIYDSTRIVVESYSLADVDKRYDRARRVQLSGIVLTSASVLFFVGSVGVFVAETRSSYNSYNFDLETAAIVFHSLSYPLFFAGLPMTIVGSVQRRRWSERKEKFKIQGGVFSNGHVGFAMNF